MEKTPPLEGLIRETLNLLHSYKGKGNIHNTSHGSYLISWKFEIYMLRILYHTIGSFWGYLEWNVCYSSASLASEPTLSLARLASLKSLARLGSRRPARQARRAGSALCQPWYRLQLPVSMKVHPVFHVSLLELYHLFMIPDRTRPSPPPIVVESESEYEVEEILDSKYRHKHLFYLVKWKSYNLCDNSWEPASFVKNAPHLIEAFHMKYPRHPKPTISA